MRKTRKKVNTSLQIPTFKTPKTVLILSLYISSVHCRVLL